MEDKRGISYNIVKAGDARIDIVNNLSYGDVYFPIPWVDSSQNFKNIQIIVSQRIPDNGLPITPEAPIFNLYAEIIPEKEAFRVVAVEVNHKRLLDYSVYFNYIVCEYIVS